MLLVLSSASLASLPWEPQFGTGLSEQYAKFSQSACFSAAVWSLWDHTRKVLPSRKRRSEGSYFFARIASQNAICSLIVVLRPGRPSKFSKAQDSKTEAQTRRSHGRARALPPHRNRWQSGRALASDVCLPVYKLSTPLTVARDRAHLVDPVMNRPKEDDIEAQGYVQWHPRTGNEAKKLSARHMSELIGITEDQYNDKLPDLKQRVRLYMQATAQPHRTWNGLLRHESNDLKAHAEHVFPTAIFCADQHKAKDLVIAALSSVVSC